MYETLEKHHVEIPRHHLCIHDYTCTYTIIPNPLRHVSEFRDPKNFHEAAEMQDSLPLQMLFFCIHKYTYIYIICKYVHIMTYIYICDTCIDVRIMYTLSIYI